MTRGADGLQRPVLVPPRCGGLKAQGDLRRSDLLREHGKALEVGAKQLANARDSLQAAGQTPARDRNGPAEQVRRSPSSVIGVANCVGSCSVHSDADQASGRLDPSTGTSWPSRLSVPRRAKWWNQSSMTSLQSISASDDREAGCCPHHRLRPGSAARHAGSGRHCELLGLASTWQCGLCDTGHSGRPRLSGPQSGGLAGRARAVRPSRVDREHAGDARERNN